MEFSSPKPKKLLYLWREFLKFQKQKKTLLKVASYDFSIFTTVKHREIHCEANVM